MAGLTVGAVSLELQSFVENPKRGKGEVVASFNNTLRSGVHDEQREFTAVTEPVTGTVRDSVNTAIANGTAVDVAGDILGTTIECIVTVTWDLFPGTTSSNFLFVGTLQIRATGE